MGLKKLNENEAPRILFVDDEREILEAYEEFLDGLGYEITFTNSSQEAWQLLEKNKFDLIVTDLSMPLLNGEELIQIIRKNAFNKSSPIIIASGNSNKIHESQASRDPNLFLLKKPFKKDDLLENIQSFFK